ncbi:MAG TPA: LuxR C-terminal-related transcriptional regulator [Streptosporangiaceae bacterium]
MPDLALAASVLATKLHVPRAQPGFVPRLRLTARLDEGLARGVTLVCAPAGSGKTSLVAAWARARALPVAWLSLDPGDNDPARFWRHAVAALDLARPGLTGPAASLLSVSAPPPPTELVSVLSNELAGRDGEVVLVLDDYHVIDSSDLHRSLVFLLDHLPGVLRIVLVSRSDPPLPLARLRARGQLAEVRAADLRFTVAEAAGLLLDVPGEAVATLTARTEGWAAGLRLAALSLRGQAGADAVRFVADFSGSNRYVLDYLAEEVLDRQDEDVRAFLLETSVLDRLSGDLCDAVTGPSAGRPAGGSAGGSAPGQEMLERVERAGLFLIPLDEERGWWRYHHLFTGLLRARLQAERPDRVPELHRAAAAWCDEHDLADQAIAHALAAGQTNEAARLVERHFDAAYMTGERATIQRWLDAIPPALTPARPRLRLARALAALVSGDVEGAEGLLAVEGPDEPGSGFEPSAGAASSMLVNIAAGFAIASSWLAYLRGDPEQMAVHAAAARSRLRDGEAMLESVYQLNLALADWLSGKLPSAEEGFAALVLRWRSFGESSLAARCCRFLAQVQRDQGRLDAAFRTYGQLIAIAEDPAEPRPPVAAYGYVGMAEVAYERDELSDAVRYVTEAIARGRLLSEREPLASALVTLAWIREAEGDQPGAVAAMEEADRVAPSPAVADLLNPIPAQYARLLLAQGDIAFAQRWATRRGLDPDGPVAYLSEQEYLVLARLLIEQSSPDRALGLLDRLSGLAVEQGRTGSLIEILAVRSRALAARGDRTAAKAALAQAVELARPRGYLRLIADERILLGDDSGLPDPLTARELEVLTLLAAGSPNQGIADQLYITLDTVKKHVTHVLAKLGAGNRTEAVARARQLGMIT